MIIVDVNNVFLGIISHMTYIALLRGINVGGNSLVKMADLKREMEDLGCKNVKTVIASGNVVFDSKLTEKSIAKKLETGLSSALKIDIKVVVRTMAEVKQVIAHAPKSWEKGDDIRKYVAFVRLPAKPEDLIAEIKLREGVDSVDSWDGVVYMTTKLAGITKSGFSKLAGKKIYKEITIRNYTTVKKLADIGENK